MSPAIEKMLTEIWAWITSTRIQLIVGGFLLLVFRQQLGLDDQTCTYIRQAVVAAVIGMSVRDLLTTKTQISAPAVEVNIQPPTARPGPPPQPPMVLRNPNQ